ncbi:MAG: hypothetical protein R6X13_11395 [bacterium]
MKLHLAPVAAGLLCAAAGLADAAVQPRLYASLFTFGGQVGLHRSRVFDLELGSRPMSDTSDYTSLLAVPVRAAEVRWFPRGRLGFGASLVEATLVAGSPSEGIGLVSAGVLGVNVHYLTVRSRRSFQYATFGTTWIPLLGLGANAEYTWVPLAPWPVELSARLGAHADALPVFWGVQASLGARVGLGRWVMRKD